MNFPKCGYKREKYESAPDWQCPSCGIAYAKFEAEVAATRPTRAYIAARDEPGFIGRFVKPALAFAFIGVVGWLMLQSELTLHQKDEQPAAEIVKLADGADFSRAPIVTYSLTTCPYCVKLRRDFEANGIPFREYFVDTEPARMQELTEKLQAAGYQGGAFGTPTLEVNGKMMPNNPPLKDILRQARS